MLRATYGHGGTIGTHNFAATLQPKLIHASLPRHLSKKLEVVEGCSGDLRSISTRAKQEAGSPHSYLAPE